MKARRFALPLILVASIVVAGASPVRAQQGEEPSFELRFKRQGIVRALVELEELRVETSLEGAREAAGALASRLVQDLIWSGHFAIASPLPEGVRRPRYVPDDWTREEDARTKLRLTLAGIRPDEMVWTALLFEGSARRQILGKRYVVDLDSPERHVHHLADQIVQRVTGDQGIAQTRIIFSRRVGDGREIFLVDYDGENLRQITRNGSLNLLPRWSPSADRVSYTSYWRGRQRLLVLDGRTGESRKVTEFDGLNYGASWAPNGEQMLVTFTRDGDPEIYRIDLRGNVDARLTFEPSIECSPVFDPTGNQIAYTSDRSGVPQIYRMSRDGTDRRKLTRSGGYNDAPTWSPRGDRIAYVTRRAGRFHVMVMDSSGGDAIPITITADGNNEEPAWAPDGRHLVVSSDRDGTRRLWVIDVDTAWARPLTIGDVDDNGPDWSAAPGTGDGS